MIKFENEVKKGVYTPDILLERGMITEAEYTELNKLPVCEHTSKSIRLILLVCDDCGQSFHTHITEKKDEFANTAKLIRQGLMDISTVTMGNTQNRFTTEQVAQLKTIASCNHENRMIRRCCGGTIKEVCRDCDRKFADQSQWILNHTNDDKIK